MLLCISGGVLVCLEYNQVNMAGYIGLVGRVFVNGPGDLEFNPRSCHTKDFKNGT